MANLLSLLESKSYDSVLICKEIYKTMSNYFSSNNIKTKGLRIGASSFTITKGNITMSVVVNEKDIDRPPKSDGCIIICPSNYIDDEIQKVKDLISTFKGK